MLRIKKDVNMKELEKYGFKEEHWGYIYYPKGNSGNCRYLSSIKIDYLENSDSWLNKTIRFGLENMSTWCNSFEELDNDFRNIKYSYECFKELINKLIEDGLVEKVEEED